MKTIKYKKAPKLKIHKYVVACIYVGCGNTRKTVYKYAMSLGDVQNIIKEDSGLFDVMEVYKAEHTIVKAYLGR